MAKRLVRVTTIEAFRKFIYGGLDFYTEEKLMEQVRGGFKGNDYTWIGTAFHSIVETGQPTCSKVAAGERRFLYYGKELGEPVPCGRMFDVEGNKVILDIPQIKTALAYRSEHPQAFHEIREFMDFGDIVVTGCADMIDGLQIRDIKTKFSQVNDSDYTNSCQSHFYMEMFGCEQFFYDLFVFDGYNEEKHGTDVRGLPLVRHTPSIQVGWYSGMCDDNRHLLHEFMKWMSYRGLWDYMPEYHNGIKV